MKIRSITLFDSLHLPLDPHQIASLGQTARAARVTLEAQGYEIQTVRLATDLLSGLTKSDDGTAMALEVEAHCNAAGFEYVSLGPAREQLPTAPEILEATETIFVTCEIADPRTGRVSAARAQSAARVIKAAANIADGFGNLRFAALANVEPGTPFFPAAYWLPALRGPAFALALESADLALRAASQSSTAADAHAALGRDITAHGQALWGAAKNIALATGLRFLGIDFSLAPFPGEVCSIGGALEALTGQPLGAPGTLTAAALLTDAIQRADFPHVGFCGLMMPVLEDSVLAQRAAESRLTVAELLQWSAVCGTGLDTVPLPGDATEAAIAGLLLDVASLAVRGSKPLTARLMPLPGKVAGDPVHFDFPYFADGGVLELAEGGIGLLQASPTLGLGPYVGMGQRNSQDGP